MTDTWLPDSEVVRQHAHKLRVLGHPARLAIALLLYREGPHGVSDIEARLSLKQPTLSQQLAILREAHLVRSSRAAKAVTYVLGDEGVAAVLQALRMPAVEAAVDVENAGLAVPCATAPRAPRGEPGDALVFATVHYPEVG